MIQKVASRAGWKSADLAQTESWFHRLSNEAIADFETAMRTAIASEKEMFDLDVRDFPLGEAGNAALRCVHDATQEGLGVMVLRGFPVQKHAPAHLRLLFWGLGLHMGVPRPQGKQSQFMSDVTDAGGVYRSAKGRGYNTRSKLDFHADNADIVGLMCVNAAMSGGESLIASSVHAHNVMLEERPDLVASMYEPFVFSRQGEEAPEEEPWYESPIFSVTDGQFACRHVRNHINGAQAAFPDVARLSAQQTEALDLFDAILARDDVRFAMHLEAGDLQFLNNHTQLHSRTEYEDWPEPERRRLLYRIWLAIPDAQPLAPGLRPTYKDVSTRAVRGGFRGVGITEATRAFETRMAAHHGMAMRIYG
ncbi:TauD/TfdA family dioxygenase [Caballeronia telluris]|uniref:Taurine catabolism dioxygenase TauD, TfdA family n=1 Tax=Caballeronia telluris TaxID=326475 RepID=A0A158K4Q6_9BURK|nr:TauD/TfdA family dioxygenase [Caballeronia telluris]SAL76097.1 Taurine catabolism dioxygenase TauD, TfdA family [Caballeronia telluris]